MENITIDLDEFMKYLLKKWKIIMIIVVSFVVIFVLSAKILGNEIVIEPSEKYVELREEEKITNDYIENSPIMKTDPTCVHTIVIEISNISNNPEKDSLENYIKYGNVWNEYEYKHPLHYLTELVTWNDGATEKSAEIMLQHYNEEQCNDISKYISEKVMEYDENAKVVVGTQYGSRDESVAETQTWYYNRIAAIEGQLEYERAGYTIEVKVPVAMVTGALAGCVVSIITFMISYLLRKNEQIS